MKGFEIKQIDYKTAMAVVVEKHYLHRKCPCSIAFGLFLNGEMLGVIVYGTPSSSTLRSGVAGIEYKDSVIELTRLWVDDSVPKNGESFLIGNTIKKAGKPIVVSYADSSQGHVGIVYQATNWLYTGLSAKRTDWHIEGIDLHGQTIADKFDSVKQVRDLYGERFSLVPRARKHRYVYINAKNPERGKLLSAIKYPILPYPRRLVEQENPAIT